MLIGDFSYYSQPHFCFSQNYFLSVFLCFTSFLWIYKCTDADLICPVWGEKWEVMGKKIGHNTPLVKTTISIFELEFIPKPYGNHPSLKDSSWFRLNFSFIYFIRLRSKSLVQFLIRTLFAFFWLQPEHNLGFTAGTLRPDLNIQAQRRAPGRTLFFNFSTSNKCSSTYNVWVLATPINVWH